MTSPAIDGLDTHITEDRIKLLTITVSITYQNWHSWSLKALNLFLKHTKGATLVNDIAGS